MYLYSILYDTKIFIFFFSFIFGFFILVLSLILLWFTISKRKKTITIVVLGDIGRSPRMQYHAISFAKTEYVVNLVGYKGSSPLPEIVNNPNIKIHHLYNFTKLNNQLPKYILYIIKISWGSINLLWTLLRKCNSKFLLIQNPPALPSLPICWLYCLLTGTLFTIDWHNYSYTILSLNSNNNFIVKLVQIFERYFGTKAVYNFCVSKAMQKNLDEKWNIKYESAKVMYDKPAEIFHPISLKEKHELLLKLSEKYDCLKTNTKNSTVFTKELSSGQIELNNNRPALIVSSTSWTEDEDFSILLEALSDYDKECQSNKSENFANLICIITGKGPFKEFYNAVIKRQSWKSIIVITPWLEIEDYPKLLGNFPIKIKCL